MKQIITVTLLILIPLLSFTQEKTDKNKILIADIEDLSKYSDTVNGSEIQYFTNIFLNSKTGRMKLTDIHDYSVKYIENTISFNLGDIDEKSVKHSIRKNEYDDNFTVLIEISTLNNSVEYSRVVYESGKELIDVSEANSNDAVRLTANGKSMSEDLAQKYLNSWFELLGISIEEQIKY